MGRSVLLWRYIIIDYRGCDYGFMAQVQTHMMSHQYDNVLKKSKLKRLRSLGRADLVNGV